MIADSFFCLQQNYRCLDLLQRCGKVQKLENTLYAERLLEWVISCHHNSIIFFQHAVQLSVIVPKWNEHGMQRPSGRLQVG